MKTKFMLAGTIALIVSLFVNIALGFNVSSKSQELKKIKGQTVQTELKEEKLASDLTEAKQVIKDDGLSSSNSTKKLIESFFRTQFDYNNETYKERFEYIKKYVNEDVYGQLTSAGIPDIPNIEFENKVEDLKIYITSDQGKVSAMILLTATYKVDGLGGSGSTQLFEVEVGNSGGSKKIVELKSLGTFTAMSES